MAAGAGLRSPWGRQRIKVKNKRGAYGKISPSETSPRLLLTEFQGTGMRRKGQVGVGSSANVAQSAIPARESISMRVERFYDVVSHGNGQIRPADEEVLGADDAGIFFEARIGSLPDHRGAVGGPVSFTQF